MFCYTKATVQLQAANVSSWRPLVLCCTTRSPSTLFACSLLFYKISYRCTFVSTCRYSVDLLPAKQTDKVRCTIETHFQLVNPVTAYMSACLRCATIFACILLQAETCTMLSLKLDGVTVLLLQSQLLCHADTMQVGDWEFNIFELDKLTQGRPLYTVCMTLMENEGLLVCMHLNCADLPCTMLKPKPQGLLQRKDKSCHVLCQLWVQGPVGNIPKSI